MNVPVTRLCKGVALKQMTFAESARLAFKLYGPEDYQLDLFDRLPHDTAHLLRLGLELCDQGRGHGERLAKFVVQHAEEEHRDKLRKALVLGRMQSDFEPWLRRLIFERSFSLTPRPDMRDLLRHIWATEFPTAPTKLFPSPIRGQALTKTVQVFRTPGNTTMKNAQFVHGADLPPGLLPPRARQRSRTMRFNVDFGEAELQLPDGLTLCCPTKVMLMLLWLPATTVELRNKCNFTLDMDALAKHAEKVEGVWVLKS
jgi:hypothetical protein